MSTAEALKELEESAEFFDHLEYLKRVATDERQRRERFVEELDEDAKAEFINGQVFVHSPVRLAHLEACRNIENLLHNYVSSRELGEVLSAKCMVRCRRNDHEPDICFFGPEKCVGWKPGEMFFPPPDLVVEIFSPSTERNDRIVKLQDYARHGAGEYWIVNADAREVEQFLLPAAETKYRLNARLAATDELDSAVVAGFAVRVSAFFDAAQNRLALRRLLGRD